MAEKSIVMENDNRSVNNEEKNIFYEYFSNLKLQNVINETEINLRVEELHSNTLAAFRDLIELSNEYLNSYHKFKGEVTLYNTHEYYKGLYEILSENGIFKRFIQCIIEELSYYISFFDIFRISINSKFGTLLRKISVIKSSLENKQDVHFLGFSFLFSSINLVEHFFNIIPLVIKKNHRSIYKKGCIVLELSITKFVDMVYNGAKCIYNIICGNFSSIAIDIANIVNAYNFSQSYKLVHNYIDGSNSTQLSIIRKYLSIAEYAYNDCSVKTPKDYLPITNYTIFNTNREGYLNLGMMYACLLICKNDNEIVVGFCGTVKGFSTKCLKTVLTDLSQLYDVSTAYIYAAGTVKQIKEDYPNFKIILCGHSLGGGLSQFAAAPYQGNVKAYCYNSAGLVGVYKTIKKFLPAKNIYHYRLENDLVSCFGELIGDVYTIKYPRSCCNSHGINAMKDAIK